MDRSSLIIAPIIGEMEDFKQLFGESLSSSNLLLQQVIAHIRQKNGKMMRPMLVLLAAKLLGGVRPSTLHAAASLELLHTASLVHDDVVDESTERRGQLSVNAIYNNKVAVLTGDYLLATALVQAGLTRNLGIIDLISALGRELADGELLQLSNVSNVHFSEDVYFLRRFGEYIGLCFQIRDDIFDYYESKEVGKPTGNDMLEGKLTLPVLYALNSSHDAEACGIALRVKSGKATPDEIGRLIAFAKQQGGIEYAIRTMDDYRDKALDLLSFVPDNEVKDALALAAYINYVVEREK